MFETAPRPLPANLPRKKNNYGKHSSQKASLQFLLCHDNFGCAERARVYFYGLRPQLRNDDEIWFAANFVRARSLLLADFHLYVHARLVDAFDKQYVRTFDFRNNLRKENRLERIFAFLHFVRNCLRRVFARALCFGRRLGRGACGRERRGLFGAFAFFCNFPHFARFYIWNCSCARAAFGCNLCRHFDF